MIYYRQWFGANPIRNRIFNYDDVIKKAIWYIKDNVLTDAKIRNITINNSCNISLIDYDDFRKIVNADLIKTYFKEAEKSTIVKDPLNLILKILREKIMHLI